MHQNKPTLHRVVMLVIHLPINHMVLIIPATLATCPKKIHFLCSLLHSLSIIWKLVRVFIYLSKVLYTAHAQIFSRGLDQADHRRMQWSIAAGSVNVLSLKNLLWTMMTRRGGQKVVVCTMIDYGLIFRHFTSQTTM